MKVAAVLSARLGERVKRFMDEKGFNVTTLLRMAIDEYLERRGY